MYETRVKDISELPDLSGMVRESHGLPKNWSFCKDHNKLERGQWAVQHVHEDLSEDIYPLPLWVSVMIDWQRDSQRTELQRSLRRLLGVDD